MKSQVRRVVSAVLAVAIVLSARPLLVAVVSSQTLGEIAGTAVVEGKPLNNITVRLRNVDNGNLVGDMRTNERGEFRFTGLPVGNYVVETVAPNRSEEHTSELQSQSNLVCRLLLEKKNKKKPPGGKYGRPRRVATAVPRLDAP